MGFTGGIGSGTGTFDIIVQAGVSSFTFFVFGAAPGTVDYSISDVDIDCGDVTFFNPGDGRIDGKAGDRVVVYCDTTANPPALSVWGVTNDSQGHKLFSFKLADLLKAGNGGIMKKVEPMGSVFAKIDANGNFFVQWFGGPAGATGDKDFAKYGNCALPAVQK